MPINPLLFRALQSRFGKVQVTHRGVTMEAHYQPGPEPGQAVLAITRFGEAYTIACPLCQAKKPCLSINHRFGLLDPFTGSKNLHLATCFRKDCLKDAMNRERLAEMALGLINRNRRQATGPARQG